MSTSVRHSSLFSGTRPNLQQNETEAEARRIFERWLVDNKKSYNEIGEKEKRFEIFKHGLRKIEKHNSDPNQSFEIGLNQFSDLSYEEFIETYGNKKMNSNFVNEGIIEALRDHLAKKKMERTTRNICSLHNEVDPRKDINSDKKSSKLWNFFGIFGSSGIDKQTR